VKSGITNQKIKKIRMAKKTASGARRKRDIRHARRVQLAELAKQLGIDAPGALQVQKTDAE